MGRATGCPALIPARISSQIWEHHGLVLVFLELVWELMTLRATVGTVLVALVCSRVYSCGFQVRIYNENREEIVPVYIGVGSCWLATSRSEVWQFDRCQAIAWGEVTVLFFWGVPVYVWKGYVIPTKFVLEVVCHDWPVVWNWGTYSHLGCYSESVENQCSLSGGQFGCLLELWADFYAWWVPKSATILRWADKGRELRPAVVFSWWSWTCSIVMMARRESLILYAACMMSQSGWRHCWMEKGLSWEHLSFPRLLMCSSDVMCDLKGGRGDTVRIAFRANKTPRYPQASVWNVERSECPPVSVVACKVLFWAHTVDHPWEWAIWALDWAVRGHGKTAFVDVVDQFVELGGNVDIF